MSRQQQIKLIILLNNSKMSATCKKTIYNLCHSYGNRKTFLRNQKEIAKLNITNYIGTNITKLSYRSLKVKKIAVQVFGKTLSQVSDFVYLGGVIRHNDMSGRDIRRRIGIAYGAMHKLKKI